MQGLVELNVDLHPHQGTTPKYMGLRQADMLARKIQMEELEVWAIQMSLQELG